MLQVLEQYWEQNGYLHVILKRNSMKILMDRLFNLDIPFEVMAWDDPDNKYFRIAMGSKKAELAKCWVLGYFIVVEDKWGLNHES